MDGRTRRSAEPCAVSPESNLLRSGALHLGPRTGRGARNRMADPAQREAMRRKPRIVFTSFGALHLGPRTGRGARNSGVSRAKDGPSNKE